MINQSKPPTTPQTEVRYLKGVGPKRAVDLERLGIKTVRDLFYHFPYRYENLENIVPLSQLKVGEITVVRGTVQDIRYLKGRRGKNRLEMLLGDDTADLTLVWFNPPRRMDERFDLGRKLIVIGKVERYSGNYQMSHPSLFLDDPAEKPEIPRPLRLNWKPRALHHSRIVPFHGSGGNFSRYMMRRLVYSALLAAVDFEVDSIPGKVREQYGLMPIGDALCGVHFPENRTMLGAARRRLKFEELFIFSMGFVLRRRREQVAAPARPVKITPEIDHRIRKRFPFELTHSQDAVINELTRDLDSSTPMNRLLQGDVGTGKTIVSVYAAMAVVAAGSQVAVMAPTEVLAEQLLHTFKDILKGSKVRLCFLSGSVPAAEKRKSLESIAAGEVDIIVGTHALTSSGIKFKDLRLVIIDEQQRFGVLQRSGLRKKGFRPHVLVMTATPIPRTLALAMYGDLSVSRLEHPPAGRGDIITRVVPPEKREESYALARKQLDAGHQAFVIVPAIAENEKRRSVESEFHRLRDDVFKGYVVETMHGGLKSERRSEVMSQFRLGMVQAMLATSIIEVGIDIPNATVMLIEDAGNFGLSALHQLRGRVGRAGFKSYCFLLEGKTITDEGRKRLDALASTRDGLELAKEDFKLRGPGEFFGTEQSGKLRMRIANLFDDEIILGEAVAAAEKLVAGDPDLVKSENVLLRKRLLEVFGDDLHLSDLAGIG